MATVETPTLGGYLKAMRLGAALSQSQLSDLTGIDIPRISEIENDRGSVPSPPTIERWADACRAELPWRLVVREGPHKGRYLLGQPEPAYL